jgi:RNA polymerase sigma factor (sigma-70 family)
MSCLDESVNASPASESSHEDFVSERSALERLSQRERQVLTLVVEGKTSREIAELVRLSPKTIDTYRSRIMLKLAVHNLASLVKFAIRHGITPLED